MKSFFKEFKKFIHLIQMFENPQTHYEVSPIASVAPKFDDYAHLARQQEWSEAYEEGDQDAGE